MISTETLFEAATMVSKEGHPYGVLTQAPKYPGSEHFDCQAKKERACFSFKVKQQPAPSVSIDKFSRFGSGNAAPAKLTCPIP